MVIDSHVHVLKEKNFDREVFEKIGHATLPCPEDTEISLLVKWLKEAGIEKAVIMGQDMSRNWNSSCGEDYVLEVYSKYPDFFIPFASVEPLDRFGRFNKTAFKYFEKAVIEYGFKGLLLTPPYGHYNADDPQVFPFYEKASELGVVVQYHCCAQLGPTVLAPFKNIRPESLNNVLLNFPELKVVVEHLNYPWSEELFFMMVGDTNLYTDLAMNYHRPMSLTWNLIKAKELGVIDRVMYGSDYWVAGQVYYTKNAGEDMKKQIGLIETGLNKITEKAGWPNFNKDDIDGILFKNAARLYGIKIN